MNKITEEEVSGKLDQLLEGQRELLIMMIAMGNSISKQWQALQPVETVAAEEWLCREEVMDNKGWSERRFYRRQRKNNGKWMRKKIDGVWHYLKESLD